MQIIRSGPYAASVFFESHAEDNVKIADHNSPQ
jgi:hypothetical protein